MLKYLQGIKCSGQNTSIADIPAYMFVDVNTVNGEYEIALGTSAARAVGVVMDACAVGEFQSVMLTGVVQVLASGTVTKGDSVEVDTGMAKTSVTAEKFVGIALNTATDALVDILLK